MNKSIEAVIFLVIALVLLPVIIGIVAGIDTATLSTAEQTILGLFSTLYILGVLVVFVKRLGMGSK